MTRKLIIKIIAIIICIPITFVALYNGLVVRTYELESEKIILEESDSITIVLISDLHSQILGENQYKILDKIMEQNPDIIFLTGDMIDDKFPRIGAEMFFEGLMDTVPVYYVTGNHEYSISDFTAAMEMIKSYGIIVLSDEYEKISLTGNDFIIAGIEDLRKQGLVGLNYNQVESMADNFSHLPDEAAYKILLAHRPENIKLYQQYEFDLVVSGHAHGGQIRIPFLLNGLIAPNQGLLPKYAGGLYQHNQLIHIVSRGVSNTHIVPRVFNPPEISVIKVTKTNKAN